LEMARADRVGRAALRVVHLHSTGLFVGDLAVGEGIPPDGGRVPACGVL
jgi:hypothetical protein